MSFDLEIRHLNADNVTNCQVGQIALKYHSVFSQKHCWIDVRTADLYSDAEIIEMKTARGDEDISQAPEDISPRDKLSHLVPYHHYETTFEQIEKAVRAEGSVTSVLVNPLSGEISGVVNGTVGSVERFVINNGWNNVFHYSGYEGPLTKRYIRSVDSVVEQINASIDFNLSQTESRRSGVIKPLSKTDTVFGPNIVFIDESLRNGRHLSQLCKSFLDVLNDDVRDLPFLLETSNAALKKIYARSGLIIVEGNLLSAKMKAKLGETVMMVGDYDSFQKASRFISRKGLG